MSHEWNAGAYRVLSTPQQAWGAKVIERLHLGGDELVADIGCGTGALTTSLLERWPTIRVLAVDRSSRMLHEAAASLRPRYGSRVQFVHGDATQLPLAGAVDCIFSTATFHWIKDHPALFTGLRSALAPGGRVVAQCGGGANIARLVARARRLAACEPYAPWLAEWLDPWEFADETTTAARLAAAGFVDVQTSVESTPTVMPDRATFLAFVANVILHRHLERLPTEALRDAFLGALADEAGADDPPYLLDYWRLNFSATRPARALDPSIRPSSSDVPPVPDDRRLPG
ncbi:MAG: class I SAM-dependent methyltransferase [Vicinamibacterales bacterium]